MCFQSAFANLAGCSLTRPQYDQFKKQGKAYFQENKIRCIAKLDSGELEDNVRFKNKHGTVVGIGKIKHVIGVYRAIEIVDLIQNITQEDIAILSDKDGIDYLTATKLP